MDDSNKQHFAETLMHFTLVHRKPMTRDELKAYWVDLKDMSLHDFDTAVAHLRKYAKWVPKPAEFWAARKRGWM